MKLRKHHPFLCGAAVLMAAILSDVRLAEAQPPAGRKIKAQVAALDTVLWYNRLGAQQPGGMIFALLRDVIPNTGVKNPIKSCAEAKCQPGKVKLRTSKRARPLVLRMNVGDQLEVTFTNLLQAKEGSNVTLIGAQTKTTKAGVHVSGMQVVNGVEDDASFVGANDSSLASPGETKVYTFYAAAEGDFLLTSTAANIGGTGAGQISAGMFGAVHVQPQNAIWYRSQVTQAELQAASTGVAPNGQLLFANYDKIYPAGSTWTGPGGDVVQIPANTPILGMLNSDNEIVYSDLTAVIAGPDKGRWPDSQQGPEFLPNPASPDRRQPYREFTIIYHSDFTGTQAFSAQYDASTSTLAAGLASGSDTFGINYGFGGIGSEILANRFGVGPQARCTNCKYEEFFLSAWAVGDPAMVVDRPSGFCPANASNCRPRGKTIPSSVPNPGTTPFTYAPSTNPATVAFYPDDPSNVYHSYLNDHVKFRILSADSDLHHIHHQHAHQWLHTPNSDESTYLDSQAIGPGSAFTLEMTYGGSGNRNRTPGDSIFHCHFYPHFAEGMWAMWRVHDVFEAGTELDKTGKPVSGARALPDGEISAGTPIPGLVPMPSIAMAPAPSKVFIKDGQVVYGTPASPDPDGKLVTVNPGYPFFIPGMAGQRAPHPPLDFAKNPGYQQGNPNSREFLDGGLPRHLGMGGTQTQWETPFNYTKDAATMIAKELPENGTHVEKVTMDYMEFNGGKHPSILPDGTSSDFITNGHKRQSGAPFAEPCLPEEDGGSLPEMQQYKAANIQLDVILNKKGWHNPQQRMLALWGDVVPTLYGDPTKNIGQKAPEPFFFRANSKTCIEYWHTNLVPNYFEVDNFQVRTPTDILGQHIHLVKFDVLASDGAANGFNYEDGTLSPQDVQERITAINAAGGITAVDGTKKKLQIVAPYYFCDNPASFYADNCKVDQPEPEKSGQWVGAQTTIQRWYADSLLNNAPRGQKPTDRTLRTVFTHDHYGPSTHQQSGLYAGLLVEPENTEWRMQTVPDPNDPSKGMLMDTRVITTTYGKQIKDGGPTSWEASIIDKVKPENSYREFALEFQDLQLAYLPNSKSQIGCNPGGYPSTIPKCGNDPTKFGWYAPTNQVVNPPDATISIKSKTVQVPEVISSAFTEGAYSINYRSEPIPLRLVDTSGKQVSGKEGDLSHAFRSIERADSALNVQPAYPVAINPSDPNSFKYPVPLQPAGVGNYDPYTPLLRAYQNDKVQVRVLVGSHLSSHDFSIPGLKWLFEPSDTNSGYRNTQVMGISEHFEMLFKLPPTDGNADYRYVASNSDQGVQYGAWGILRAYDAKKDPTHGGFLPYLPNNPTGAAPPGATSACPPLAPKRPYVVHAVTAEQLPDKQIVFNKRLGLINPNALVYLLDDDYQTIKGGQPLPHPLEPLVLRAAAGECIQVTLHNDLDPGSSQFPPALNQLGILGPTGQPPYSGAFPVFAYNIKLTPSWTVGLHPQLVSYDVTKNDAFNVGNNPPQTVAPKDSRTYEWYAGNLDVSANGQVVATPAEFGATNLLPSDPLEQHQQGLFGALIIEPKDSTWKTDDNSRTSATVSSTNGSFEKFREFVGLAQDDATQIVSQQSGPATSIKTTSAFNYGAEPWYLRLGLANNVKTRSQLPTIEQSCGLSIQQVALLQNTASNKATQVAPNPAAGNLYSPVFAASAGTPTRFRILNPGGVGDQIFELHGHVWQEEPYKNGSTVIGENPVSQWQGSRMGFGPTNHYDVVLRSAGGAFRRTGDFLYRTHEAKDFRGGMWGAFRVTERDKDSVAITANRYGKKLPEQLIGYNTVNPDTGQLAKTVDIFSGSSGSGCTGTKLGTANIEVSGGWTFNFPGSTPTEVCVQSPLGAVATLKLTHLPNNACCANCVGAPLPPKPAKASTLADKKAEQMDRPNVSERPNQ